MFPLRLGTKEEEVEESNRSHMSICHWFQQVESNYRVEQREKRDSVLLLGWSIEVCTHKCLSVHKGGESFHRKPST